MNQNFTSIEEIIAYLKSSLQPLQRKEELSYENNKFPLGFIIGNPRSGTTLFLQYLVSLGCFAYPSNVLARFAYAPYFGALIQQMLFNNYFDPLNELNNIDIHSPYESNLGKSYGFLAPNEFQHFFRNYINNYFPQHIDKNEFENIDFSSLISGLSSIEAVFNQPFVTKATMLQYNLVNFHNKLPNCIFFYIKRDPLYVMQSIYMAREKYYGDVEKWWSVKPKEYDQLSDMDIYHQIAGQVYYTEKSIEKELEKIPEDNKVIISYEVFCNNPLFYLDKIKLIYKTNKCNLNIRENSIISFKNTNNIRINKVDFENLRIAYKKFNH